MKKILKYLIAILLISLVGIGLVYVYSHKDDVSNKDADTAGLSGDVAGVSTQDDNQDNSVSSTGDASYLEKLARHLTASGMILYGAYWDQDTNSQKEIFGDAARLIDYVECDQAGTDPNPDECVAQNILIYPTWIYKEQQYNHLQSLADLAKISGFTDVSDSD